MIQMIPRYYDVSIIDLSLPLDFASIILRFKCMLPVVILIEFGRRASVNPRLNRCGMMRRLRWCRWMLRLDVLLVRHDYKRFYRGHTGVRIG